MTLPRSINSLFILLEKNMVETADKKRQIEKLPENAQDVVVDTNLQQAMRAYHPRLCNMNTADNQTLADIEWIEKRLEPTQSITTIL